MPLAGRGAGGPRRPILTAVPLYRIYQAPDVDLASPLAYERPMTAEEKGTMISIGRPWRAARAIAIGPVVEFTFRLEAAGVNPSGNRGPRW